MCMWECSAGDGGRVASMGDEVCKCCERCGTTERRMVRGGELAGGTERRDREGMAGFIVGEMIAAGVAIARRIRVRVI